MRIAWLPFVVLYAGCAAPPTGSPDATAPEPDAGTILPDASTAGPDASSLARRFKAEVWADNWFALWLGETQVAEDSVPITTQRSFNAETFTFSADFPLTLNFVIKDYTENATGLEYIGLPNQQMGDGGFIMQITDLTTGRVVAISNGAMKCLVINKAPLNPSCEKDSDPLATCLWAIDPEPAGWKSPGFDASSWQTATVYTETQVGPKDKYFTIAWDASARLVWTADLKVDNTLLCKLTVTP